MDHRLINENILISNLFHGTIENYGLKTKLPEYHATHKYFEAKWQNDHYFHIFTFSN